MHQLNEVKNCYNQIAEEYAKAFYAIVQFNCFEIEKALQTSLRFSEK